MIKSLSILFICMSLSACSASFVCQSVEESENIAMENTDKHINTTEVSTSIPVDSSNNNHRDANQQKKVERENRKRINKELFNAKRNAKKRDSAKKLA